MRTRRVEFDILMRFKDAALDLQKVILERQRVREFTLAARAYYREQKSVTLHELSWYQFLFSESYQKLSESGSTVDYPDIFDPEIITIIQSGRSYQDTCLEIIRVFGRKVREAKALDRADPTGTLPRIKRYEKVLSSLFKDYQKAVIAEVKLHSSVTESIHREESKPFNADPAEFYKRLDWIERETIIDPSNEAVELEIPEAYQAGGTFGSIVLGGTLEQRQTEWKKIAALIEGNKQSLSKVTNEVGGNIRRIIADGVINERTLGDIIRDIYSASDVGISRSLTIARTEVMIAVNNGVKDRYKQAGVENIEWLTALDDKTCDVCRGLDGQKFPIDNHPIAPRHPRCRCSYIPSIALPKGDWWEGDAHLDRWSDEFKGADIEHYGIYDEFGNMTGKGSGNPGAVKIIGDTKNKVIIHNHPGTEGADLSNADLKYAFSHDVKEMIAITPAGERVSIRRPAAGWPNADVVDGAWKEALEDNKNYYISIRAEIKSGKISELEGISRLQDVIQPSLYKHLGITVTKS